MGRKIILNLAMSLDGYIARKNGSYEWIGGDHDPKRTKQQFRFEIFIDTCDTIIMGKHSFDMMEPKEFIGQKIIVFTHETRESFGNVTFVNEDIVPYIKKLKKDRLAKNVYIFGGADLVHQLLGREVIDEYIIGVIPLLLGDGIRLFEPFHEELELTLYNYYLEHSIMILHYINRSKSEKG